MQVYDDFLKPEIAQEAYEFVLKSYYQIGWEDSLVPEQRTYPNLHSRYNSEDIKKFRLNSIRSIRLQGSECKKIQYLVG